MCDVRRTIAVAALLCAGLVTVPAAHAQADKPPVGTTPNGGTVPVPPKDGGGQVSVDGAGSVRVTGNLLAYGDLRGISVRVIDRYGNARVLVDGRPMMTPLRNARGKAPRSVTLRPGPKQRVTIEGYRVDALFRGARTGNLSLSITGVGTVRLDGVGTYQVNGRAERSWPLKPVTIPLRPTPPGGRG